METISRPTDKFSGREISDVLRGSLDAEREADATKFEREMNVTAGAVERLEGWGLTNEQIVGLVEIGSAYEYADIVGKAEAIASRGVLLSRASSVGDTVVLPGLYDYDRRKEGQCGEIALKIIRDMRTTGWMLEANDRLEEKGMELLVPVFFNGLSRTHFNQPGMNHVWAGVGRLSDGPRDAVIVDGSFKELMTVEESGYKPNVELVNPTEFHDLSTSGAVSVGTITPNWRGEARIDYDRVFTLGITTDGSQAIALGYARMDHAGDVQPFLRADGASGTKLDKTYCYMNEGQVQWIGKEDILTSRSRDELESALAILGQVQARYDKTAADVFLATKTTINYRSWTSSL
jgi:hypothetical protein